jgi:thymidylate synthase
MNKLDKQYTDLLQTILEHGVDKEDRTGTGTRSIFGYTIRHNMKDGFPLLTTKKMPFRTILIELLWFLQGRTDLRYLLENNCHIWTGDAYKVYDKDFDCEHPPFSAPYPLRLTIKEFENKIITNDDFNSRYGDLGPIYGKQWRNWIMYGKSTKVEGVYDEYTIDQIQNLINDLKTNPDSRRLMVNAWNVGELDQMVLPPCHYGFQVYTRELSFDERCKIQINRLDGMYSSEKDIFIKSSIDEVKLVTMNKNNIPTRAISLMWNQRSVDTFLGLPFNIASYGLLLEIISKEVNMVPDQLIGNLGDTHLYTNHLDVASEQIGRDLTDEERYNIWFDNNYETGMERFFDSNNLPDYENPYYDPTPHRTREPFPLPSINFNTEFWDKPFFEAILSENFCKCLLEEDVQLSNYESHAAIPAPLSN